MREEALLKTYYEAYDEEGRLLSKHGQVEYITTQKYIHACANAIGAKRILEIGAGTGRYSVPLSKEGFDVTAGRERTRRTHGNRCFKDSSVFSATCTL